MRFEIGYKKPKGRKILWISVPARTHAKALSVANGYMATHHINEGYQYYVGPGKDRHHDKK